MDCLILEKQYLQEENLAHQIFRLHCLWLARYKKRITLSLLRVFKVSFFRMLLRPRFHKQQRSRTEPSSSYFDGIYINFPTPRFSC